eukprot:SAG31_NODE_183_length_20987_cov_8.711078_10_plen_44_part_00
MSDRYALPLCQRLWRSYAETETEGRRWDMAQVSGSIRAEPQLR